MSKTSFTWLGAASALLVCSAARAQTLLIVNDTRDLPDFDLTNPAVDADGVMPGNQITLRAAIEQACTSGGAYRVVLPAQTLFLNRFGADDACHWGDLDVFGASTTQMTIEGAPGASVIDASGFGTLPATADRIFDFQPSLPNGALLEIKNVRLQLGSRPGQTGGGIRHSSSAVLALENVEVFSCSSGNGGGIYAAGPLHAIGGSVTQCTASIDGGGLHVAAALADLDGTSFFDDTAAQYGGAIFVAPGAALDASGIACTSNDAVEGGGLRSRGAATVAQSSFIGNVANSGSGSGGNVSLRDSQIAGAPTTLSMSDCTLGGGSGGSGAGLYVGTNTWASIARCSFELNIASGLGGGLSNQGITSVRDSTFSDNQAASGGGLQNFRALDLRNCTFASNRASNFGGGLYLSGLNGDHCSIDACTIAGGQAAQGGGLYLEGAFGTPLQEIKNSFLADNRSTLTGLWQNGAGTGVIVSHGFDVDTDGTCALTAPGDRAGTIAHPLYAGLGPLGFYGGATRTLPLLECSAAHCAASTTLINGLPNDIDQRGVLRGTPPDAGAYDAPPITAANYCTAGTTSSGCVPSIAGYGVFNPSSACGFTIEVTGVEGQKQGVIFYGTSGAIAIPWGLGSTSFLCVKAPTQRTTSASSGGTAGSCNGSFSLNLGAWLAAHPSALGALPPPGQQFYAQAWFRDPPSPKTTNLSDAISFIACP